MIYTVRTIDELRLHLTYLADHNYYYIQGVGCIRGHICRGSDLRL